MPSATSSPPCSTTARHMAHCPNESIDNNRIAIKGNFLNMKCYKYFLNRSKSSQKLPCKITHIDKTSQIYSTNPRYLFI